MFIDEWIYLCAMTGNQWNFNSRLSTKYQELFNNKLNINVWNFNIKTDMILVCQQWIEYECMEY